MVCSGLNTKNSFIHVKHLVHGKLRKTLQENYIWGNISQNFCESAYTDKHKSKELFPHIYVCS